jgi:deoxyuridine 5'-triphosphate nucleotidohydrolase
MIARRQVEARGKALVPTDLAVFLPVGTYGRVAPRSGLSWKKHIDVGAGVIDRDYRGNVGVVLFNHGEEALNSEKTATCFALSTEADCISQSNAAIASPNSSSSDTKWRTWSK